ncbi:MAG: hypothetical protein ABSA46_11215 [Thermodesulfovibrionales bacterium]|jgi:ribosomal 50S subunit-associated protein YjgA (DUF615 family)
MEKKRFLTFVAEVMKGMISYDTMMAAIQRSCMRAEVENLELMRLGQERVDRLIEGMTAIGELAAPDDVLDVLVLRYLKNTQFLASLKEEDIDVSGLDGDLDYWKKTMLFRAP